METIIYGSILSQNVHLVPTKATKQKINLTKAVKEYAIMMEMPCRPLNMESLVTK